MRNGTGGYTLPTGNPVVTGTVIDSVWANATMSDIGNEIANSIAADGQTPMNGPLRFISGSVSSPGITFNAETGLGLYRAGSGILAFTSSGSERMRLVGANLLIGTTTDSGERLNVAGNTKLVGTLGVTGNTTLTGTLNVTGATTVPSPTAGSHATTKDYVDAGMGRTMVVTSSATVSATANTFYIVTNMTNPTTVTLPANPTTGEEVWVNNATGRRDLVIARNGRLIHGLAEDFEINQQGVTVKLRYIDNTYGWRMI